MIDVLYRVTLALIKTKTKNNLECKGVLSLKKIRTRSQTKQESVDRS